MLQAHVTGTLMGITETKLKLLVGHEMNGRQIKKAVHMANALAESAQELLEVRHIEKVLDVFAASKVELKKSGSVTFEVLSH